MDGIVLSRPVLKALGILDEFNASAMSGGVVVMLLAVTGRLTSSQVFSGEALMVLLLSS